MQEDKIKLPNRYNKGVYLEKIKDNSYKLIHKSSYVRLGFIKGTEKKYTLIDISGGPIISLKDKLPVGIVKSISKINNDYIIEVEE